MNKSFPSSGGASFTIFHHTHPLNKDCSSSTSEAALQKGSFITLPGCISLVSRRKACSIHFARRRVQIAKCLQISKVVVVETKGMEGINDGMRRDRTGREGNRKDGKGQKAKGWEGREVKKKGREGRGKRKEGRVEKGR